MDDLTSDVMFEAVGGDLAELFAECAKAMFSVICKDAKPKVSVDIDIKADGLQELLFRWLQELIALVDIEEMFFSRFDILEIDMTHLKAKVWGEPITPGKSGTVVKSVTNYGFMVNKADDGYRAQVCLDI